MSDTQTTDQHPVPYTSVGLTPPSPFSCTSPHHEPPEPAVRRVTHGWTMRSWPVCLLHDPTRHTSTADCPACPDGETWNRVHCYACGAPDQFHPRHDRCFS